MYHIGWRKSDRFISYFPIHWIWNVAPFNVYPLSPRNAGVFGDVHLPPNHIEFNLQKETFRNACNPVRQHHHDKTMGADHQRPPTHESEMVTPDAFTEVLGNFFDLKIPREELKKIWNEHSK